MNSKIIAIAGWGLTLALSIGLVVQQQKNTARIAQLSSELEVRSAVVASLEKQIEHLNTSKEQKQDTESQATAKSQPQQVDPAAMLKGFLGGIKDATKKPDTTPESKESKETEAAKNPFNAMFEGEQGERMMETGMEMSVSMQYGGLFADLNLSPEKEAALKEALLSHMRAAAHGGMASMRGEKLPDNWHPPTDADLLASVKDLLSPEEYDQFAAYQEELPERMMRQQVETQLGMFASGLSEEAYATTVDVLVDKLTAATQAQTENAASTPGAAMNTMGNFMQTALDDAMVELEGSLSAEDAARVRRYVDQQRAMYEMFANMSGDGSGANVAVSFSATSTEKKDQ